MVVATKPKLSITELSALYDRIYDIADRLLKKHNPCNIHKTKRGKIKCKNKYYTNNKLCCNSCEKYWSKTGCITKCLSCKLYLCPTLRMGKNRHPIFYSRLLKLREYARNRFGGETLWRFYYSKEDWLKLLEKVNGNKRKI